MIRPHQHLASRPMFLVALALAGGIALRYDPLNAVWLSLLLCFAYQPRSFLLIGAGVLSGWLLGAPVMKFQEPAFLDGEGRVMAVPRPSGDVDRALVHTSAGRLYVRFPAEAGVSLGDRVVLRGHVRLIDNPGWWGRGVSGTLREVQSGEITRRGSPVWRWGLAARDSFGRSTEAMGSARAIAYLNSVVFSQTQGLEDEDWVSLRQSGTIHVVSTSGLHVVIAASGLLLLLSRFPISRLFQILVLCAVLLVYAGAAGFRPPILRAVMMAMIGGVAYLLQREKDGLSMLGLTAVVMMIWMPEVIFEMNFQLSFLSVAMLTMFGTIPRMPERIHVGHWAWFSLRTVAMATLTVTVGLLPVLALYSGVTSWTSVLANVLIVPLLPVLIGSAVFGWALSAVLPGLGGLWMEHAVAPFTGWLISVVDRLGKPEWAVIPWPEFHPLWLVPYFFFLLLYWRPKPRTIIL